MRISDWSSDVCSSDLPEFSDGAARENGRAADLHRQGPWRGDLCPVCGRDLSDVEEWGAYRFRAPAGTRLWSAQSCLSGALDPPTGDAGRRPARRHTGAYDRRGAGLAWTPRAGGPDRKSTRLNSSP